MWPTNKVLKGIQVESLQKPAINNPSLLIRRDAPIPKVGLQCLGERLQLHQQITSAVKKYHYPILGLYIGIPTLSYD